MKNILSRIPKPIKILIRKCLPMLQMRTVHRVSLDGKLIAIMEGVTTGKVLDVGSMHSPYRKYITCGEYIRFDVDETSEPDICGDLHDMEIPDNSYDCIIATEVLEHLYDPIRAMSEIRRVLKPGGCCIMSTPFLYCYHGSPHDYYRFTWDSLSYICRDFTKVDIQHHGNIFVFLWQLLNDNPVTAIFVNLFNPIVGKIQFKNTAYPSGFVVVAYK
ncbi:class I SAM-dependent methyltransferase [Pseudomonadales bacterium]|nr:class I SAM-dependent methyltransferase [Pseudomonadales bacterium]MDA8949880.1 class I SAM-dependent methyltransferase [Pseudomonadales bacterium]